MFIVAGEALMDVYAAGMTDTGLNLDARIGGSPLNVAIGLARLGQPVGFLGALSDGFLGDRLAGALQGEGVSMDCAVRLAAPATLSLVGLDASGVPSYAFYGAGCADRDLPLSALDRVPANARAFHFGSYAMVVGQTAATQRALVERQHGRGLISYDPNVRLNVEPDLKIWRDTLDWMSTRIDILKVSDEDLHLLYPDADHEALAREWLARGVGLVAITRGGEGALAWTTTQHVEASAVEITVVDTVGAGDTFAAALLARLAELESLTPAAVRALSADSLSDAIGFATRAAALTCTRRGADLPRRGELTAQG